MKLTATSAMVGLLLAGAVACRGEMVHRWSFNAPAGAAPAETVVSDPIKGATGTVRGVGGNFTGAALTLPGTTTGNQSPANISAYVDLPNGIISSKTHLTVEIWATVESTKSSQRLMDFGRTNVSGNTAVQGAGAAAGEILPTAASAPSSASGSDSLNLVVNRGAVLNTQRVTGQLNGGTSNTDTAVTLTEDTLHHFVLTFTDGAGSSGANGGQVLWYLDGTLVATRNLGFHLSAIEDVNNWLGRAQFTADSMSNITYDEVRIYDHAMGVSEIAASMVAGPNAAFAVPVAANDSATVHRGQKVRVPVLANDSGDFSVSAITIVQPPLSGTATPTPDGKIIYAHTTGTPASDSFTYRVNGPGGASAPATVTITFSDALRMTPVGLNVPASPPPLSIQPVPAFGSLGFSSPTCMASPPGDSQRLFICSKTGALHVIPDVTSPTPSSSVVLTLSAATGGLFNGRVPAESLNSGSEMGLLGLAFHPNFATNGYIYIFYSVSITGVGTFERVSRLTLNNHTSSTPTANLASELVLIEQLDEAGNHNGGDLHFGADGYLYISLGDEGNQNDTFNNSQRIDKDFFSSILRIDVDKKLGNLEPGPHPNPADYPSSAPPDAVKRDAGIARFSIPIDNPFVHTDLGGSWTGSFNGSPVVDRAYVRTELWAVGLRNPWRMSFDRPTGDLWCGDVGGSQREEVSIITRGGNYGWAYREGINNGPKNGQAPANFTSLYHTPPIYDYAHGSGNFQGDSITGGIVYRGTRVPSLTNSYIFADYQSGNIWSLVRNGGGPPTVTRIGGETGISAFAHDPSNGDVLIADYNGNRILRLAQVTDTSSYPNTLSATNLFADFTDLAPASGVLPYSPNLPFWSDYALKARWFTLPNPSAMMTWSRDGLWTFPQGTIWVKHFDLETTRGNPATKKRIETRLIVKNAGGAYGVSYRWNDAGTDATLVADGGEELDVAVTVDGTPTVQRWSIPSRAQCLACHTPQAGHALSFTTRQMNRSEVVNGFAGNQLTLLQNAGYFGNTVGPPNVLPRHLRSDETGFPVEARVRSYLAVNCAYCHQAGGTAAPAAWDGRPEITLDQTGLINGTATNNGGNLANKLIVPNDTAHSIVLNRVAVANGFTRMPPVGSNQLDQGAIALLTEWITDSLPARQTYADWRFAQFGSASSTEGEASFDADGDGRINSAEFLAGTGPLSAGSFFVPQISTSETHVTLSLAVPANRSFQIETSVNLVDWSPWDIAGNDGVPSNGAPVMLIAPRAVPGQYFRVRIWDN